MKKIYDNNGNLFAELNYSKEYFLNYSKHSHETFSIGLIGSGGLEVKFHSHPKQYLYPNQVVIFNPNQVHTTNSKIKNTSDYYTLHVNKQWCKKVQTGLFGLQENFIDTKQNILDEKNIYDDLIEIFKDIILNNNAFVNKKLEKALVDILKEYSHLDKKYEKNEYKNRFLDNVEKYILDNIDNPITLEDIASEVGYNEAYITRVFKKEFGLTPHAFLINKRIEKAKRKLLKSKNVNLAQLSNEVGFYDQSHFSKVFKRVFAMTPNKYKME